MLQFMGSQRVRRDLTTEQQQQNTNFERAIPLHLPLILTVIDYAACVR